MPGRGLLSVSPARLDFAAAPSGPNPPAQELRVSALQPTRFSASGSAPWILVSPRTGTTSQAITVSIDARGLASGTYAGNVTVAGIGTSVPAVTVPVTLTVSATVPAPAALQLGPDLLVLNILQGSSVPASLSFSIGSSGEALNWSASTDAPWLAINPASGRTPSSAVVSTAAGGLAVGIYNASITVSASGASPQRAGVVLAVGRTNPTLSVAPASLRFSTTRGSFPGTQSLSIRSLLPEGERWSASATVPWLQLGPVNGQTPGTLFLNLNDSGVQLPVGSYSGAVLITAVDGSTAVAVPVSLTVQATATPPVKR